MGNKARLGVICLMGLAIGLARMIEVEYQPQRLGIVEASTRTEGTPAPARVARGAEAVADAAVRPPALPQVKPSRPAEKKGRTYTVKQGDTLDRISRKVYGTRRHWRLLRDANKDRIPDPRRMRAGVELRVPAKPKR